MRSPAELRLVVLLAAAAVAAGGNWHAPDSDVNAKTYSNQFLRIRISPGWTVRPVDRILQVIRGKYTLSINPIFVHASGVEGGRFSEIAQEMPSVNAVMKDVDQPGPGGDCTQSEEMVVTRAISLTNLYTDNSQTGIGCVFPLNGRSVWFGSVFGDRGSESDYALTLGYDTTDVNDLPKRGSRELGNIFRDVVDMLKTLSLKPPVVITKMDPEAAAPGATVQSMARVLRYRIFEHDWSSANFRTIRCERPSSLRMEVL